jgi:heterodisulfide reductase subunit A-like polyferredoxin
MVCQEFCPYQAIDIVDDRGINCPEVDESLCRGCGACQSQCPAIPERAIVVRGMADQELIEPMSRPE